MTSTVHTKSPLLRLLTLIPFLQHTCGNKSGKREHSNKNPMLFLWQCEQHVLLLS